MKKIALVTGGSRGIGKEIVKTLALNGYTVIFSYVNSRRLANDLVKDLQKLNCEVFSMQSDIASEENCKNLVEYIVKNFGHIDVLVNNAGICYDKLLIDDDMESISNLISVNLLGTINMCRFSLKHMISKNYGKIINIASILGTTGCSCESIYSASKGGIIAFTKSLSKEVGNSNITVNCISPGFIETDMCSSYTCEEKSQILSNISLSRFGTPQDISNLVKFLASDEASYITGQNIGIDGGMII